MKNRVLVAALAFVVSTYSLLGQGAFPYMVNKGGRGTNNVLYGATLVNPTFQGTTTNPPTQLIGGITNGQVAPVFRSSINLTSSVAIPQINFQWYNLGQYRSAALFYDPRIGFSSSVPFSADLSTSYNIPDDQINPIIGIACPNIVYPYLRANVADLITRAGFPPVNLAEMNFEAMYQAQMAQAMQEAQAAAQAGQVA